MALEPSLTIHSRNALSVGTCGHTINNVETTNIMSYETQVITTPTKMGIEPPTFRVEVGCLVRWATRPVHNLSFR